MIGLGIDITQFGTSFSPLQLPSLGGWWDIGNESYTDAGMTTKAVQDDPIYTVKDTSGNNRHMVQATLGNRPIYSIEEFPCGIFNGTTNQLAIAGTYNYPATMTVYAVAYTEENVYMTLFGAGYDGGGGATTGLRLGYNTGSVADARATNGASLITDSETAVYGVWTRLTALKGTPNLGVYVGSTGTPILATPIAVAGRPMHIGARDVATSCWNGMIAEVLFYEVAHDAATRAIVWDYLRRKYGV